MINENLEKLVQHARDKKPTDFKTVLTSEIDSRIGARVSEIRDGLSKNMFSRDGINENCEGHPDGVEHTHEDGTVHTHEGGGEPHTHDEEEVSEGVPSWQAKLGSNYDKKKDGRNAARKAKNDAKKKDKKDDQDEGTLPPALQKAIDAKKKDKGDDDEDDKDDKEKDEGTLPPALQKAIDAKKKDKGDDDEDEDDSPVGKKDENIKNFGDKKAKPFTDDDNPTDNKKKKDNKEDIRSASKRILDKNPTGR